MNIIVYYRTRPSEPEYSDQALEEQRTAISFWLADHPATITAQCVELETDGFSRPSLREAIEACKQTGATLLIARTEAIGSGTPFSPRILSISVAFAPKTPREVGHFIPSPQGAPTGPSLYFPDHGTMSIMPVYLCNETGQMMRDIELSTVGVTSKLSMNIPAYSSESQSPLPPLATEPTTFAITRLAPNTAVLAGFYDPMIDGDFITAYQITFVDPKAQIHRRRALFGAGGPTASFAALTA